MVAYIKPQQRKKEESERLRGERAIRSSLLILDLKEAIGKRTSSGLPRVIDIQLTMKLQFHMICQYRFDYCMGVTESSLIR